MKAPHRFEARSKSLLMDEDRRKRQSPESVLGRTDARSGQIWADLGCGVGYFTIPLARMGARVLAMDAQSEMLETLVSLAGSELNRICPLLANIPPLPLLDASVDRALMVNVLHEVADKELIASEIFRILKPDGHLILVDFQKRDTPHGPPIQERLSPEDVLSIFRKMRQKARWDEEEYYQLDLALDDD
ncbi:MAG: class I SAM-dependent methyltransferase [Methanomassiliicoccales archaeon]|nr:class I SAM-dependent methyltransferase [Methanomassiliicoccales archaeon]NYT16085.1 class I SAM-dependent methyltransferase [Methanomassiliicoccales archaeon]